MSTNTGPSTLRDPSLALDAQLCFALYSAQLAMGKIYRRHLADLGLTYPQYLVMLVLWQHDGLSVTELGDRLYLDSATLTPLLKRLQALGLLRRDRTARDQRRVVLTLTQSGQALKARAQGVPQSVLCATGCPPEQAQALKAELEALRAQLQRSQTQSETTVAQD
jgi:DNA-binding MarR family transcriptional regulator